MVWYIAIAHLILAIILFYIVNWIGAKAKPMDFGYVQMSMTLQDDTAPIFNFVFKVLAPVIYIILLAALLQAVGLSQWCDRIYWIVIDYWAFRLLFVVVKGQAGLQNWLLQLFYVGCSVGLALWVNSVIDRVDTILPDPKSLLEELWILVILFLYSVFNKLDYSRKGAERRIEKFILNKYSTFSKRYGSIINEAFSKDELRLLVYSIMIYEDFNRPVVARFFERIILCKPRKPHTYGVMQVKSPKPLSDEESVKAGVAMIKQSLRNVTPSPYDDEITWGSVKHQVIRNYNPGDSDYYSQVDSIYDTIKENHYPDLVPDYTEYDLGDEL